MKNIDQVKSRIHKLLNMTKSENENEAKIALVQAQKLAMTYQLDLEDAIEEPKEDEFDQNQFSRSVYSSFAQCTKNKLIYYIEN